jgi:hypothetical protein
LPHPAYSPDSSLATAGLCDRAQVWCEVRNSIV